MQTKIVTLSGIAFEGAAKAVHAVTSAGEVTILDHHQPLISVLAPETRVRVETESGAEEAYPVQGGFLHMNGNNQLTILAD